PVADVGTRPFHQRFLRGARRAFGTLRGANGRPAQRSANLSRPLRHGAPPTGRENSDGPITHEDRGSPPESGFVGVLTGARRRPASTRKPGLVGAGVTGRSGPKGLFV